MQNNLHKYNNKKIEIINPKHNSVLLLNLHPNEQTSIQVGKDFTTKNSNVSMIHFKDETQREIVHEGIKFDCNRIFTNKGIEKELKRTLQFTNENFSILKEFAQSYLNLLKSFSPKIIIALHNNKNQGYTMESYFDDKNYEIFKSVNYEKCDFILTTSKILFEKLKQKDVNCVLEKEGEDDGSLSIYCKDQNITYVNIEAKHDNYKEQFEILKKMIEILKKFDINI